jgi:hypothetical protein
LKNLDDLLKLEQHFNEPIFVELLISNGKVFFVDLTTKRIKTSGLNVDVEDEEEQSAIKHIKKLPERDHKIESYFG